MPTAAYSYVAAVAQHRPPQPPRGVRLCDTMSGSPPGSPVLRSPRPDRQLLFTCWRPARGEGRPSWTGLEGDPADRQGSPSPGPRPRPGKPLEESSVEGPSRASRMRVKQSLAGQAAAKSRRKHTPSVPGAKKAQPVGSTRGASSQAARSHMRSKATGLCLLSGGRTPAGSSKISPRLLPNTLSKESPGVQCPRETPRKETPTSRFADFCQSRHRCARDGAELRSSGPRVSRQPTLEGAPWARPRAGWKLDRIQPSKKEGTGEDPSRSQTHLSPPPVTGKARGSWRTRQ